MNQGSCHCGAIAYEVNPDELVRFSYCHCHDCRKLHGTTHSSVLVLREAGFRLLRGADHLTAYESSPGKFRHFCRTCGAPAHTTSRALPGLVIVRAGGLDGDPGVRPQFHIWVSAKAPWYDIHDSLPQYLQGPPPR